MRSSSKSAVGEYVADALTRISEHPFVRNAHVGRLSRDQLHRWIFCAGRESRSFPQIIERMLSRAASPLIREVLFENLQDELGRGNPEDAHFQHYLQLLTQIGVSRGAFEAYREKAGVSLALELATSISNQTDDAIALGYMLVNEGMTPITYGAVDAALRVYYPHVMTDFFRLHTEVDAHHIEELYRVVDQLSPSDLAPLMFGICVGERGMAVLLDEALGVFDEELHLAPAA